MGQFPEGTPCNCPSPLARLLFLVLKPSPCEPKPIKKNQNTNYLTPPEGLVAARRVRAGAGEVAAAGAHLIALVVGDFRCGSCVAAIENVIGRKIGDRY